jgi:hypothetical protein
MRSTFVAYLLWLFLGPLGVHRFYCNRIGTGILWFFTGGLLGIGWLIDIFLVPGMVSDANAEDVAAARHVPLGSCCGTPHGFRRPSPTPNPGLRILYCTRCGQPMQVPLNTPGGRFACPSCHGVLTAPA